MGGAVEARVGQPPLDLGDPGDQIAQFVAVQFRDRRKPVDVAHEVIDAAKERAQLRLALAPAEQHAVGRDHEFGQPR